MHSRLRRSSQLELEPLEERQLPSGLPFLPLTISVSSAVGLPQPNAPRIDSPIINDGSSAATTPASRDNQALAVPSEVPANPVISQPAGTGAAGVSGAPKQADPRNAAEAADQPPLFALQITKPQQAPPAQVGTVASDDPDDSELGSDDLDDRTHSLPSPVPKSAAITNDASIESLDQKPVTVARDNPTLLEPVIAGREAVSLLSAQESEASGVGPRGPSDSVPAPETHLLLVPAADSRLPAESSPVSSSRDGNEAPPAVTSLALKETQHERDPASQDQSWQESQPLAAGWLTGGLALDASAVQTGVRSFLAQLDHLGSTLWNVPTGPNLYWTLLGATLALSSCEFVRRYLSPSRRLVLGSLDDPLVSWDLLPEDALTEEKS